MNQTWISRQHEYQKQISNRQFLEITDDIAIDLAMDYVFIHYFGRFQEIKLNCSLYHKIDILVGLIIKYPYLSEDNQFVNYFELNEAVLLPVCLEKGSTFAL